MRVERLTSLAKTGPVRRSKVQVIYSSRVVYLFREAFVLFIHVLHVMRQDMSAEVVDSNPYSRLMALQRMGIVENYERIREFSVAIVVCI